MISPDALAALLDCILDPAAFPEPGGIWRAGTRPVARVGFALEPTRAVLQWARDGGIDALFLHRPWTLDADALPADVAVLWSHLPFDRRLTIGHNPHLAAWLEMTDVGPFAERDGRPLGMIGDVAATSTGDAMARVRDVFDGAESIVAGRRETTRRVAVVGAMTGALVRAAHDAGADLYVTGQLRAPAAQAVEETGIAAVAVGHRRSEQWALRLLARLVSEGTRGVETAVWDGDGGAPSAG